MTVVSQHLIPSQQHPLQRPELLAPAGNWDCAKAAIENGADAIYFGLDRFNARMRAQNFTEADLPELMAFLHQRGVKGYVTLNTLIFQNELTEVEQYLRTIMVAGVDAVIVQDVGLCQLIRHLSPDFPIHASTQMTITSAVGVEFAKALGCNLVVLARECSLKEIQKIQAQIQQTGATLPLEAFVHGALCVAYSGQCLTSEALGGRSANRGECAQACRMPYELVVDGQVKDLGGRQYLLSPQDLAGLAVLPELVQAGLTCLKIEGRLKTPEYVANVTRVYRQALDRVVSEAIAEGAVSDCVQLTLNESYNLEMAFSRGLYTGWFQGIHNQELVHARFGKKRGVYLGEVLQIQGEKVMLRLEAPLKAGDGVVFDNGHPERPEEGGRVYTIEQRGRNALLAFGRNSLDFKRIQVGDKLWKTSDPELDRQLRQSYAGDNPKFQRPIALEVHGEVGQPMTLIAKDLEGHIVQLDSEIALMPAEKQPLTTDRLREQLGRLGNTPFFLGELHNHLGEVVILPVSELNRLRRELVERLLSARSQPKHWQIRAEATWQDILPTLSKNTTLIEPQLLVLVRSLAQLDSALEQGIQTLYCELEDPRAYGKVVKRVRTASTSTTIWVAPPRITKPNEQWILEQVRRSEADGYLIRNYDQLAYFKGDRCIGDFSLNIANAITASTFKQFNLERLTASYDLNIQQLEALLRICPADWFEITLHQHMPMFHMEHCVFCAFLSTGKDFRDCGRPCEQHEVKLRVPTFHAKGVRTGTEHVLHADVGCRNTVFNGTAQTGAEYLPRLLQAGCTHFRIEFLRESPQAVTETIAYYQRLLKGEITGTKLWKALKLQHQLGVTRGTLGSNEF